MASPLVRQILKEVTTTSCMPSVPVAPETPRTKQWKRQVNGKKGRKFNVPGVFFNNKFGFAGPKR